MRSASILRAILASSIALVAASAASSYVLAQTAAPADGDAVVAKVGVRTITVREVERRLATMPPFQLRYFGKTHDEIRRKFVEETVLKETLYAEGAEAAKMRELPEVAERVRSVLRNAIVSQIRAEVAAQGGVTDEEVRAYYDANRDKYHAPSRVAIWRILVATREQALDVIQKAKADLSPKRWNELARDLSLDKSTNMRGGNLGLAAPDGTTTDPNVKVDVALVKAVEGVKDSELVPEPVAEGSSWAVVWRRQSIKAVDRPIELEAPSIKQILMHERTQKKIQEVVAALRKEHLGETNPDLLEMLGVSAMGEITPAKRPGTLPSSRRPAAGPPAPSQTPAGPR
ncbi:peptidyl-prolyl cis-trans isomerase [Polyangium jinanense]|uniref:Peptidyl-prolyl cis-trans isomerase n=1 Tax=Polyangium jinanense TaxID=2829994 RepID=A0A9X4AQR1_9BACT|nr:peptidyl-prolyl cis-trans isomerase [Polyangium jinanense]MDC3953539.1 peptidyl-prolyl cis-trans isomerase [Polyangium jinanense]MDC3979340.1 peptidyl-prolyl cis-trans isomerase [Polyangium jinanense]